MRKTLFMHFRLYKRSHGKLGKTGLGALARGGVTVVGLLNGDEILWGATKCFDENYSKANGRAEAEKVAMQRVAVTKNVPYEAAKAMAESLGHLVYRNGVTMGIIKFKEDLLEVGILR